MASSAVKGKREPEDDLETKPILKKHKEESEEKGVAVTNKTLYIGHLSRETKISHIIDFFDNVGEVVRVRLIVNRKAYHGGYGFVEFASANEAKKALEKKNGEYLHDRDIYLGVAGIGAHPPMYCIEHKVVWYEDYLRRESLLIKEDETVEGLVDESDESSDFDEEVAARKKTLFVANLSPQTKISHIHGFFNCVGKVVSVRLIVNYEGKHVGCGFVEFGFVHEAKRALRMKNGEYLHDHKLFLDVVKIKIAPYPPRTKYNLVEKLWYEDYLVRESVLINEVEGLDELNEVRKKTLYVANLSLETEISYIIDFLKDVGQVVSVRLIVDHEGKHVGYGYVEFVSANEAKKVLEKKNGEYLHDQKIVLHVAKDRATSLPPKYCIDHKVWYEDYLSLMIEEDENETVEGLVEEVATRKKTLFVANFSPETEISDIKKFFKRVGVKTVSCRLIVNHEDKNVGCAFVEFASANEAKKALEKNNGQYFRGHEIFVDVVKIAPYPLRPKYNLAEKIWYENYLRQESVLIEEDDLETKPIIKFQGTKITFVADEEALC